MNKRLRKILSISLGMLFLIFLVLLPTILIQLTVRSVKLSAKIINVAENYKKPAPPIAALEPIEKEKFFHFLPGSKTYFLEITEQNFACANCREEEIKELLSPEITKAAVSDAPILAAACSDSASACDYAFELAKLAKEKKLATALIYNNCLGAETLKKIISAFDAVRIELGITKNNYCQNINSSATALAIKNMEIAVKAKKHLEISYLLNQTNSSDEEINNFLSALKENLGAEAIIHFSGSPNEEQAVSAENIKRARDLALSAGFKYVYAEKVDENTYCADGSIAMERQNYFLIKNNLKNGACLDGSVIPGAWQ